MTPDGMFSHAEKIIKEAQRKGAKEVEFRFLKLTELPLSLRQLDQLQFLDLSNNRITKFPEVLHHLPQLKTLDFSKNDLTVIPESLGLLTQLTALNLSYNNLTTLPESLGQLTQLQELNLSNNRLIELPESLSRLKQLRKLNFSNNRQKKLPESLGQLTQLHNLNLSRNQLSLLPQSLSQLTQLQKLNLSNNNLKILPEWIGKLTSLLELFLLDNSLESLPSQICELKKLEVLVLGGGSYDYNLWLSSDRRNFLKELPIEIGEMTCLRVLLLGGNQINDLPSSLFQVEHLSNINLENNPLNLELTEAYKQGIEGVKAYLRAKANSITLNEAKLILVGEGEVGKTCLLDALLDKPFQPHDSTHGIEIQSFNVTTESQTSITLNAWDFGGQRVYRPTHQLFFSAPAVYLVVWKPREGSQAGQVKEWIQLVKRREPSAKILVVATHGGPQQRQPDIDRQELWDLFGRETVVDFFFVDSKPDAQGNRKGIDELKRAIAQVAASLPEVGRSVPKSFADVRQALQDKGAPYLPLREVLDICRAQDMDDEIARLFITISHRLGHLTHYENDPTLRDIVILRPDWLATAMSYVLDDEATRAAHGLVKFSRLAQLWDDKNRADDSRYPDSLHPIFLRLMERFDLSYRVADPAADHRTGGSGTGGSGTGGSGTGGSQTRPDSTSLIGQLVPDIRPQNLSTAWESAPASGDIQQTQICHIVDASNGQSASAEGLFYQLIVRLHKYSLGRVDYNASVHWQRGLVLEDEYKSRAFLEHVGNDVRITVRSPYPEGLLGMLTREVKFLVESFWEGLRCDVMVPCINPCGKNNAGTGLFEVEKLMDSKRKNRHEFPCPVCTEWQNIDALLRNAPAAQPNVTSLIFAEFTEVKAQIESIRQQASIHIAGNVTQSNIIVGSKNKVDSSINISPIGQFSHLDTHERRIFSQVDKIYTDLLQALTEEARENPRLFSFFPIDRSAFKPKTWIREKFRIVLWCEHSRLPLPILNNGDIQKGVYDLELDREWFKKASPYLNLMTKTLSLVLPIAYLNIQLALDETAYKLIEEQLDFGKSIIDAAIGESSKIGDFLGTADSTNLEHGVAARADGSTLRELHALLKSKDPGFGGLVRVMNKRQEFLWVHEKFAGEY